MFFRLLLLLTVVPLIELMVLIKAGQIIGLGNTILMILLTGVIGTVLARVQGLQTLANIQARLSQNQLPTKELLDGVLILAAGLVLLTPGFITDAIGFLLLFPGTRALLREPIRARLRGHVSMGASGTGTRSHDRSQHTGRSAQSKSEGPVIDVEGEIVDEEKGKDK